MGRPRQFDDADERRLILDSAYQVLRDDGALTVTAILATAGISTRSFYRHFESKDALLCAMYVRDAEWAASRLTRRLQQSPDPVAGVETWIDEIYSVAQDPRRAERVSVFRHPDFLRAEGADEAAAHAWRLLTRPLRTAIMVGAERGVFDTADVDSACDLVAASSMHACGLAGSSRAMLATVEQAVTTDWCLRALGAGRSASDGEAPGGGEPTHPVPTFDPDTYLAEVTAEIPRYHELQTTVAEATGDDPELRILELGVGTGETASQVLARHPGSNLVAIDASAAMLAAAARVLPGADLRVGRLEDDLPEGPFDLIVSVLAAHHLDGAGKADLFGRLASRLAPGGRFVLGDLVVPVPPGRTITLIDDPSDRPDLLADQVGWLQDAGLHTEVRWSEDDLAVVVARREVLPSST